MHVWVRAWMHAMMDGCECVWVCAWMGACVRARVCACVRAYIVRSVLEYVDGCVCVDGCVRGWVRLRMGGG